jgi:hypothetical protein
VRAPPPPPPTDTNAVAPPPTVPTPASTDVANVSPSSTLTPPLVPSGSGPPPAKNNITPDWQAQKSEQALAAVQARYDQTKKEIDDLEKAGKPQDAADKKILLKRLEKQMADIKVEIANFKAAAAGDAGAIDAAKE